MLSLCRTLVFLPLSRSLGACGPDPAVGTDSAPPPASTASRGVIHLDLRLVDGGSPTALISRSQVELATDLDQDWLAQGAELRASEDGACHVLEPPTGAGAGLTTASLCWTRPLEAARWDALEITCRVQSRTGLRLRWTEGGRTHTVAAEAELTPDPTRARSELSGHPSWRGTIEDVTLSCAVGPQRPIEVFSLRFLAGSLVSGFAPLGETSLGGALGWRHGAGGMGQGRPPGLAVRPGAAAVRQRRRARVAPTLLELAGLEAGAAQRGRLLFDSDEDPHELDDLGEGDRRVPAMARSLQGWMEILGRQASESAELTAEDEAVLRSLGYAGSRGD